MVQITSKDRYGKGKRLQAKKKVSEEVDAASNETFQRGDRVTGHSERADTSRGCAISTALDGRLPSDEAEYSTS